MRRRLRKFLPIVLVALAVQIFAPIGACWAASTQGQTGQTDPTGQHRAHDGCCSVCSVLHTGAPVDTPQTVVTTPSHQPEQVVWFDSVADLVGSRTGSHAQARAPPQLT